MLQCGMLVLQARLDYKRTRGIEMNIASQHCLLIAVFCLAGCASQPPSGETAAPDTAVAAAGEPDHEEVQVVNPGLVCRTEAVTGSHMHQRRCYTRDELAEMEQQSREFLRTRGSKGAVYTPTDKADPRNKTDK